MNFYRLHKKVEDGLSAAGCWLKSRAFVGVVRSGSAVDASPPWFSAGIVSVCRRSDKVVALVNEVMSLSEPGQGVSELVSISYPASRLLSVVIDCSEFACRKIASEWALAEAACLNKLENAQSSQPTSSSPSRQSTNLSQRCFFDKHFPVALHWYPGHVCNGRREGRLSSPVAKKTYT